jgi:hypothetical protein
MGPGGIGESYLDRVGEVTTDASGAAAGGSEGAAAAASRATGAAGPGRHDVLAGLSVTADATPWIGDLSSDDFATRLGAVREGLAELRDNGSGVSSDAVDQLRAAIFELKDIDHADMTGLDQLEKDFDGYMKNRSFGRRLITVFGLFDKKKRQFKAEIAGKTDEIAGGRFLQAHLALGLEAGAAEGDRAMGARAETWERVVDEPSRRGSAAMRSGDTGALTGAMEDLGTELRALKRENASDKALVDEFDAALDRFTPYADTSIEEDALQEAGDNLAALSGEQRREAAIYNTGVSSLKTMVKAELAATNATYASAAGRAAELEDVTTAVAHLDQAAERLEELTGDYASALGRRDDVGSKLSHATQELNTANGQVQLARHHANQTKHAHDGAKTELSAAKQVLQQLEANATANPGSVTQAQLDQQRQTVANLQGQFDQALETYTQAKHQLTSLESRKQRIGRNITNLKTEKAGIDASVKRGLDYVQSRVRDVNTALSGFHDEAGQVSLPAGMEITSVPRAGNAFGASGITSDFIANFRAAEQNPSSAELDWLKSFTGNLAGETENRRRTIRGEVQDSRGDTDAMERARLRELIG